MTVNLPADTTKGDAMNETTNPGDLPSRHLLPPRGRRIAVSCLVLALLLAAIAIGSWLVPPVTWVRVHLVGTEGATKWVAHTYDKASASTVILVVGGTSAVATTAQLIWAAAARKRREMPRWLAWLQTTQSYLADEEPVVGGSR
jgi:hypothetical protein